MNRLTLAAAGGLLLAAAVGGHAQARPPLKEVTFVSEGLINTAIAYEISRVCPELSPRIIKGIRFLESLQSHARGLGYSDDEISAYTKDRVEKDRLEDIARGRLADMGAVVGEPATYCGVGRAEITAESDIGNLLR